MPVAQAALVEASRVHDGRSKIIANASVHGVIAWCRVEAQLIKLGLLEHRKILRTVAMAVLVGAEARHCLGRLLNPSQSTE